MFQCLFLSCVSSWGCSKPVAGLRVNGQSQGTGSASWRADVERLFCTRTGIAWNTARVPSKQCEHTVFQDKELSCSREMRVKSMPRRCVKARQPFRVFAAVLSAPNIKHPRRTNTATHSDPCKPTRAILTVCPYIRNSNLRLLLHLIHRCRQVNTTRISTHEVGHTSPVHPKQARLDHGHRRPRPSPLRVASVVPAGRGIAHAAGAGSARRVRAAAGQHEQHVCAPRRAGCEPVGGDSRCAEGAGEEDESGVYAVEGECVQHCVEYADQGGGWGRGGAEYDVRNQGGHSGGAAGRLRGPGRRGYDMIPPEKDRTLREVDGTTRLATHKVSIHVTSFGMRRFTSVATKARSVRPPNANASLHCTSPTSTRSSLQTIIQQACNMSRSGFSMYTSSVVHLPHVDQLLSSCSRNLVWQLLVAEGFPCGLDDVHLVP